MRERERERGKKSLLRRTESGLNVLGLTNFGHSLTHPSHTLHNSLANGRPSSVHRCHVTYECGQQHTHLTSSVAAATRNELSVLNLVEIFEMSGPVCIQRNLSITDTLGTT